jgi:Spy/CpxP family protein refolding chaperone
MKMKWIVLCGVMSLILAVAAVSSLVTAWVLTKQGRAVPEDYHAWIHQELAMTDEQENRLEPSERRYEEAKRHLTEVIRIANQELAAAIAEDRANSPRVQAAVERIHEAMGQLQQATLHHIFEMKEVLEPEQYDRLIELTREALESQGGKK